MYHWALPCTILSTVLLWGWGPSARGPTRVLGVGSAVGMWMLLMYYQKG